MSPMMLIEPPILIDTGLPAIFALVVFLGLQGGVPQIQGEEFDLFEERLAQHWQAHRPKPSPHGEGNQFSSRAFCFVDGNSLPEPGFHVGYHFLGGVERAKTAAFPEVFLGLGKAGINTAALGCGVFSVSSRKLRAVNYQPRRDDDLAPLKGEIYQIALGQARLTPDAGGNGYLAFVLDFRCRVHENAW